jgi:malate dehydrogenase (oxaloacetate-decarboxylating)(NADP+)
MSTIMENKNTENAKVTTDLQQKALDYHAAYPAGKLGVSLHKPAQNQHDLSLAYSPGVSVPVLKIAENPEDAYKYTNKGNLVAVISNGTAVLGLGNVGALAGKPVMEGKAMLFKRFANIDSFDVSVDALDPKELVEVVSKIALNFGGINLEDIRAPECFYVEQALIERLDIPVFHDDQHGTAIVVAAALLNALELNNKSLHEVQVACVGAGAAGIATINLLTELGLKKEQICLVDTKGVIHTGRTDLNEYKKAFALSTNKRSLEDSVNEADVFIGLSQANLLTPTMLKTMNKNPIVFAMANPNPEIHPKLALETRDDVIIATGRSDLPNQVNNTLCFPYIFRAALDVRASKINLEMKIAAVQAIRNLTKKPVIKEVLDAYKLSHLEFGKEYLVPKPLDPRLLEVVPPAIAKAAISTGVAKKDFPAHYPSSND